MEQLLNPQRFEPKKSVLIADKAMNSLIKIGGVSVILAVMGIFVFIFFQILPLFQSAKVTELKSIKLPDQFEAIQIGTDEWSEKPFLISDSGQIQFIDTVKGSLDRSFRITTSEEGGKISDLHYLQSSQTIAAADENGLFSVSSVKYKPEFEGGQRAIMQDFIQGKWIALTDSRFPIRMLRHGQAEDIRLVAGITQEPSGRGVRALTMERSYSLFGGGDYEVDESFDLTSGIQSEPLDLIVSPNGDSVVVRDINDQLHYFEYIGGDLILRQIFTPFEADTDERVASYDFLLGGVTIVVTGDQGSNPIFSLHRTEASDDRRFGLIREMGSFSNGSEGFALSLRNKAFFLYSDHDLSLRYSTTGSVRWHKQTGYKPVTAVISGKYDRILIYDENHIMHQYELNDPHPEAGLKAFFSKIWYEGYNQPGFEWQSTGGTDQFEPKLSLIPLIIGSLKGTFYALLFALPIAILAAVYTSQFAHPKFKQVIKPTMEIMASLPSVVLGFLAALWLAPILEYRTPSVILVGLALPAVSVLVGILWTEIPNKYTTWLKPGYEFLLLTPILIVTACVAWNLGPSFERIAFTAVLEDGTRVADFRLWWSGAVGSSFEQRNSLIVGFMMGFAVIPIIFTITEDALTNVAPTLTSASLALGASRWQTAMRVVMPSASAGILSAIMVGFGRAVGETMIVVMATGNTPIMDFNIFSGMRTLSANIAVELPEAPFHGTLYRTLFLGALALFIMTFCINTVAEILRERLRARYKTV